MKDFVKSDYFLELSVEEQRTYLILSNYADEKGVVSNPKGVGTKHNLNDYSISSLVLLDYIERDKNTNKLILIKGIDLNE